MEIWKDIPGWEGFYQASNTQKIKSLSRKVGHNFGGEKIIRERVLKQTNGKPYKKVLLQNNGRKYNAGVHHLIALAFHENPENKLQVNHDDGDTWNNVPSNLYWATPAENINHAINVIKTMSKGLRKVTDTATGQVFKSAQEAHRFFNFPFKYATLTAMLRGNNPNKTSLVYEKHT